MDNPLYANGFRIAVSAMEAQLTFRIDTPVFDPANNQLARVDSTELADIRMSPVLAKQLSILLAQNVEAYEKQFGTIKQELAAVE